MNNNLRQSIDDALIEKASFNQKVENLIKLFYDKTEPVEILAIIEIVIKNGHPRIQKSMEQFKINYENDSLDLEDMAFYFDMYEKYKNDLKNC